MRSKMVALAREDAESLSLMGTRTRTHRPRWSWKELEFWFKMRRAESTVFSWIPYIAGDDTNANESYLFA